MKFKLELSVLLLLVMLSGNILAQYNTLPDSRIIQLDDYADLTKWTHTGANAPPITGAVLKNGTVHTHVEGWMISEARTGYAGNFGRIIPPLNTSNYAANLRNISGAMIESPYFADGIGTLYFEAVNSEMSALMAVFVATNMVVSGGGFAPMQLAESATLTYNWVVVDSVALNYSGSDFGRFAYQFNYAAAAKFRIVRSAVTDGYGVDDQFLVVDNIRVSYPPAYVVMSQISTVLTPASDLLSGILTLRCRLDQCNAGAATPTVSLVCRTAPPDGPLGGWTTNLIDYVSGTGSGRTGLEFEGSVPLAAAGQMEYYYSADFDGYYVSPDYTGLNATYPTESLSPASLFEDGIGGSDPFDLNWAFGTVPPVTELPDSRILIFDDYDDLTKWTHTGSNAPPFIGVSLRNGTTHTHISGWKINETRTGHAGSYGKVVPQKMAANYAGNLRNVEGATIESPLYEDGVGTIYFEAVNSEIPTELYVYMATNMFDYINWTPVELGPEEGSGVSNLWYQIDVLNLNYTAEGQFYRYCRLFNYRDRAKVKFVRKNRKLDYASLDDQFLVVDNIRISPPPTDVGIMKTEVISNPGYPHADSDFTVRCYVSNTDMYVPTAQRTVVLVHRWRYLTQQVDGWQTNQMSLVEGSGDGSGNEELYECTVAAPVQSGDIEYFYLCYFGGYVYESPDYTGLSHVYPSEDLAPQVLRGDVSNGGEFSLRLRGYESRYGAVYVVSDQHPNPIQMDLIGDHQWRGMVPLNGVAPTNLSWNLMAEREYFDGAGSYATNRTHWSASADMSGLVPNLPCRGVLAKTDQSARITVTVTESGYMEVSFNTDTLEFMVNRAEYQNFNLWPASGDYFSASNGQSDKLQFKNSFDEWELSRDEIFIEPFTSLHSVTGEYQHAPFPTPNGWIAGSAAYVAERTLDAKYGPEGINNYRNMALRLRGGDPVLGLGYVFSQVATLPDGLKQLKFKARLGQKSDNSQICYHQNYFASSNYVVKVRAGAGNKSPENPSLSVIVYYQDYENFYEFRVVQRANPSDVIGNVNDRRADLYLYKWINGVAYQMVKKSPNVNFDLAISTDIQVSVYNNAATTFLKCKYGNVSDADSILYTDTSAPFRLGTFGVLSSECFSGFSTTTVSASTSQGEPTGVSTPVIGPLLTDISAQVPNWFVPNGVHAFIVDMTPPGIYKVIPSQKLNVYLQVTDYDSGQEPTPPGTLDWVKLKSINVPNYEYVDVLLDIRKWQAHFVMLQVGEGGCDVAVDELESSSWRGQEIGLGGVDDTEWLATEARIVSNGVGSAANQVMQLDHSRADPGMDQAVRSPQLENGMGLMEFDYRVLRAPARLTVQYAKAGNLGTWFDLNTVVVSNVTDWAHFTAYLGSFDAGCFRVLNERTAANTNALVEINNVIVWDEPFVDDKFWTAYNAKISSADPMRLLLDSSKGCFLNNSEVDETNPSPQDREVPHLQSPALIKGLGTLTFRARAYDPGEPATIYVYVATNGWSAPREEWVLIHQFDNIDHEFYRPYSFTPVEGGGYNAIRLETAIGEKRVCIEEVAISEPLDAVFNLSEYVPLYYMGEVMSELERSWIGASLAGSNRFELASRDFAFDANTNLHLCVRMSLNGENITTLQGGAALKLQATESLLSGEWATIGQYSLTADSFDANNECNLVVINPLLLISQDPELKSLFLRWRIDLEEPMVPVVEL